MKHKKQNRKKINYVDSLRLKNVETAERTETPGLNNYGPSLINFD